MDTEILREWHVRPKTKREWAHDMLVTDMRHYMVHASRALPASHAHWSTP